MVSGNPLDLASFASQVKPSDTFVQLVGTPHPGPAKAKEFREIDLVSVTASARAAADSGSVRHFVYVSVAQPAPIMKVYQDVRAEGEALIRATGIPATFLRPWYVLGPGHRWPYALIPFYRLAERVPAWRGGALRLGLVSLEQFVNALVHAVEHVPTGVRIVAVPELRRPA